MWVCVRMSAGLIPSLCVSACVCVCAPVAVCLEVCVLLSTDSRSKIFRLPDAGSDSFHGLTEKYVSFLGFTEGICTILGSRRGVDSRILGRNLTNSRILVWKNGNSRVPGIPLPSPNKHYKQTHTVLEEVKCSLSQSTSHT